MFQFLFVFVAFAIVGIRLYTELVTDVIGSRSASQWKKLSEIELNRILQKLQYYRELNASEQIIFLERVMYFCDKKVFLGMDGMLITDEVRAFVSASAVQIGLRMIDAKHYIVLLQDEQEINSYDQMIISQEEASKVQKGSMLITVTKTGLFGMQYPGDSYVLDEGIIP